MSEYDMICNTAARPGSLYKLRTFFLTLHRGPLSMLTASSCSSKRRVVNVFLLLLLPAFVFGFLTAVVCLRFFRVETSANARTLPPPGELGRTTPFMLTGHGKRSTLNSLHESVDNEAANEAQDMLLQMLLAERHYQQRSSFEKEVMTALQTESEATSITKTAAEHLRKYHVNNLSLPFQSRQSVHADGEIVPPIYSGYTHPPLDAYANVLLPTGQCLSGLACRALLALHKFGRIPLLVKAGYVIFQTGGEINFKLVPRETRERLTHLDIEDAAAYASVLIKQSSYYFFTSRCIVDSRKVTHAILHAARNLTHCLSTRDKLCYRSFIVAIC